MPISPVSSGKFIRPLANNGSHPDLSKCDTSVTPDCLRALYNIPVGTLDGSSFAVSEFGNFYQQTDLDLFYANTGGVIPAGTAPTLSSIDGGVDDTSNPTFQNAGESDLDVEYAIAIGKLHS